MQYAARPWMGSLEARKSNARFMSVLFSSVCGRVRDRDGAADQEFECGLDQNQNTAVAGVHGNAMEAATRSPFRSEHCFPLEIFEELESAFDRFTFPLVEH